MGHNTNTFSWGLPLAKTQGETDTPQQYLQQLSRAKDGFYPMGANSLWHGGIHLDNGTGLTPHSVIGCITGGEVIAYRVDENYPTVTAELVESESVKPDIEPVYREETASYSSGFVLVRHRFKIPEFPPPTVSAITPETNPAAETTLTFYSLYMHLCDWAFYVTEYKLPRPAYWGKPTVFEVGEKSKDRIKGCFVRIGGAHTTKLAILPRGTSIVIGEKHPDSIGKDDRKSWYKLDSLVTGEALNIQPNNSSVIGCYVFPGEMTRISDMQYRVAERGHDFDSTLLGHNIYSKPKTEESALLSVLPRGAKVQIGHQEGHWGRIEKLLTDKAYPALPTDAEGKLQAWIELPKLIPISTPQKTDDVVVLEAPHPVKTDELMSYPGIYQGLSNVPTKTPNDALRVHIEVFTPEDMPALIKRTTELAERQPVSEKTWLKVNQGTVLYQPQNADKEIATETQLIKVDNPKAKGQWLEVQKVCMGVVDKKLLGPYTKISRHPIRGAYSVSITNKPSIAEALNVQTQDVPDTVFFRGECLNQNGKRLNTASPPATYPLREIYFPLANDSDSYWIDADKMDHEDRKVNPDRVIAAWSKFPLQGDNQQVGTVSFEQVFSRSEIEAGQHCHDHQGTLWWLLKTGKENSVIGTESFGEIIGWIKHLLESPTIIPGNGRCFIQCKKRQRQLKR